MLTLAQLPEADPLPPYARLIHDVLEGDRALFTRPDGLSAAWKAVTPLARLVNRKPVPQQALFKSSSALPVPAYIDGLSSGENSVAPPVPPNRASFTRLSPKVERRDSDVVHRVDC